MTAAMRCLVTAGAALLLSVTAVAQFSLCAITITPVSSNGGGSVGGALYFEMQVTVAVRISAMDVNTDAASLGQPVGLTVYTTPGTYAGKEGNPALWTPVAVDDGTTISAGTGFPTTFTFQVPFFLPAGTHGIALVASSATGSFGHRYTNGNGANQFFTDGTMSLALGSASNVPFIGTAFTPRVLNGCIHYDGCSVEYGSGCAGSGGYVPDLNLAGCAIAGKSVALTISQALGGSTAVLLFGSGRGPLSMGAGCFLNLSALFPVAAALPMGGAGPGAGSLTLTGLLPASTKGLTLNFQAFTKDPGGALGFASSNGLEFTIK